MKAMQSRLERQKLGPDKSNLSLDTMVSDMVSHLGAAHPQISVRGGGEANPGN